MNIVTNNMYDFLLKQAKLQSFQAMQGFRTLQTEKRGYTNDHPIMDQVHLENAKEELVKAVSAGADEYIRGYLDQLESYSDYDDSYDDDDAEAV